MERADQFGTLFVLYEENDKIMKMLEELLERLNDYVGVVAEAFTAWLGNDACVASKLHGIILDDHIGIDKVREIVGPAFKVYSIRHSDLDWAEPATLENREVIVNHYAYFIIPAGDDLDWAFAGQDSIPFHEWSVDEWV